MFSPFYLQRQWMGEDKDSWCLVAGVYNQAYPQPTVLSPE